MLTWFACCFLCVFCFHRRNMLTEELPTIDALDSLPFENYKGYDLVSSCKHWSYVHFCASILKQMLERSEKKMKLD